MLSSLRLVPMALVPSYVRSSALDRTVQPVQIPAATDSHGLALIRGETGRLVTIEIYSGQVILMELIYKEPKLNHNLINHNALKQKV